jgi:hypothetical protein
MTRPLKLLFRELEPNFGCANRRSMMVKLDHGLLLVAPILTLDLILACSQLRKRGCVTANQEH